MLKLVHFVSAGVLFDSAFSLVPLKWIKKHFLSFQSGFSCQRLSMTWKCTFKNSLREKNHKTLGTCMITTQMFYMKSLKMTLNSKQNRQGTQETERRKTSFLKELVENVDLHKSV